MSLAPGTRLGPYEIAAPLGAGGMGEVFRARDTRLDRTVAIKILPPVLAGDPQFRERFDREARAISALNHPHICTLHDIGEERGTAFLVMEHVDGETLAARLERGALPVAEAIAIAIQIADALDAAHRRGIVHRDVKPANIMIVRRSGSSGPPLIKLLDFGLARTAPAVTSSAGQSIGATVTGGLTGAGTILGTIQYMAPEQVEGLEADSRTDIFALGVVLYEMVTGQRAFSGRTPASLISAILKDHPPAISMQQPLAPASLDRTVRRCLAKDPDDRWQTMRDLKAELQWVAESRDAAVPATASHTTRRGWLERAAWIGAVLVLATAVIALWQRPAAERMLPLHATIDVPADLKLMMSGDRLLTMSPDGRRVAFPATAAGLTQIYLRDVSGFEVTPVRGTDGGSSPFFSPDGQWLGFVADRTLRKVPVSGGTPMILAPADTRGAVWTNDDRIIFTNSNTSGLWRIAASGGTPEPFTTLAADERSHRWPSLLPDGKAVLFTIQPTPVEFDDAWIAVKSLVTGEQKVLVRGGSNPVYLKSGHIAFGRAGALLVVPFDADRLEVDPTPVRVVDGVSSVTGSGAFHYALSGDGTLVYLSGPVLDDVSELVWVGGPGEPQRALESTRRYLEIGLSPDGRRIAATIASPGGNPDIWVFEVATGAATKLTFSPGPDVGAAWSPDGRYVTYRTTADDKSQLIRKPFDGGGPEEVMAQGATSYLTPGAWHKTGGWITYHSPGADIFVVPTSGDRTPVAWLATPAVEVYPAFSPDGRWIAYQSNEEGQRFEIYVQPFPATGARWRVSSDGGVRAVWARDGSALYFRSTTNLMAARLRPGPVFAHDTPRRVAEGSYGASYDVTGDGRFLMIRNPRREGPPQIRVVLDWLSEVRSRTDVK